MQKQAPTLGRLATMVFFALSCFGLLLFLWLAFGGPIPLKPKGYEFRVAFPEVSQLATQSDVRVAGVEIGKVVKVDRTTRGDAVVATLEIDRKYAPISADARAQIRNKTILGQTYVELTLGSKTGRRIPDGGLLDKRRVGDLVSLDEILNTLDPYTRQAYRTWQQGVSQAVNQRGDELNDTIGNLPEFVESGGDLFAVLDENRQALGALVRNTGVVFAALTEREDQLRALMVNTDEAFSATAEQKEALAETFQIFPTFLDESRATMVDLESFSRQTRPLVRDLRPALQDLRPTLRDVRALAPDLTNFYRDLDPLITVSKRGLPALREVLRGAKPLLGQLQPFLEQLNPILEWLEYHQHTTADFFSNGGGAVIDTVQGLQTEEERGHYLGQFGVTGEETFTALMPDRPEDQRGNAYPDPTMSIGNKVSDVFMIANWDCSNTGKPGNGEYTTQKHNTSDTPSCWEKRLPGPTQFPHIQQADYSKGG